MLKRFIKFFRLEFSKKWLLIKAVVLLATIRTAMFVFPFRYWKTLMLNPAPKQSIPKDVTNHEVSHGCQNPLSDLVWAVEKAGTGLRGSTCLMRAITLRMLLLQQGYSPVLVIGVSEDQTHSVFSHAWVELDGQIVLGELPDLYKYKPFASIG